jgi:tRNA(Ile)-lysidine synthase TilS/MesJ
MKLQKLLSYTRKAVDAYHMIQPNDIIAVGISGGKDSLALLYALKGLQRFYPNPFTIEAITVDLGFGGFDLSPIVELCQTLDVHYTIVNTEISDVVFNERKEKSPCSLCAKMRKGALIDKAKELSCNKLALGHHKEDIIETMFLSLFYEGRFHTFSPVTYLDRMDITSIRPLMYVPEREIVTFIKDSNIPVVKNPCPEDGYTKREYMKDLIKQLSSEHPGLKDRLFKAIEDSTIKGWQKNDEDWR